MRRLDAAAWLCYRQGAAPFSTGAPGPLPPLRPSLKATDSKIVTCLPLPPLHTIQNNLSCAYLPIHTVQRFTYRAHRGRLAPLSLYPSL